MAKNEFQALLDANPQAKRDKKVIIEALREVRQLRAKGIGGRGYSLVPPFGEKGAFRRNESSVEPERNRFKVTDDA